MERCCSMERELILSHRDYHIFAADSFIQLKRKGCLALFKLLNNSITCTNTLIMVPKQPFLILGAHDMLYLKCGSCEDIAMSGG